MIADIAILQMQDLIGAILKAESHLLSQQCNEDGHNAGYIYLFNYLNSNFRYYFHNAIGANLWFKKLYIVQFRFAHIIDLH